MSEHYGVVKVDTAWLERLSKIRPVTDEDRADAWTFWVECSDPASCPGWEECTADHGDLDPNDEDSPVFDQYEDVEIHGELHEWRCDYGWTTAYGGCPVAGFGDYDTPEDVVLDGPRRYLLDVDWDEGSCWLTVVREITHGEDWA